MSNTNNDGPMNTNEISRQILNLHNEDPFHDLGEESNQDESKRHIHLRVHQRNARKCTTTVEGIDSSLSLKKMLTYFKKKFNCNGALVQESKNSSKNIIQLSGDHRSQIKQFLIEEGISSVSNIVVHGF